MSLSPSVVALSKVILTAFKRIQVLASWLAVMQGAGWSDFESAIVLVETPVSGDFGSDWLHFPTQSLDGLPVVSTPGFWLGRVR